MMESETMHTMHRVKLEESTTKVGPILAKRLLEGNKLNRDFRASHARDIARQMKLGRWKASPEPIVIKNLLFQKYQTKNIQKFLKY